MSDSSSGERGWSVLRGLRILVAKLTDVRFLKLRMQIPEPVYGMVHFCGPRWPQFSSVFCDFVCAFLVESNALRLLCYVHSISLKFLVSIGSAYSYICACDPQKNRFVYIFNWMNMLFLHARVFG